MSADGGSRAVLAALAANTGIAVTKFVAFLLTGISSMLAEAIHSVADSGNQVLLLVGGKRSQREADERAPVRLRPRALHLRVHRVDRAVLGRWPLRALRGVPQVRRDPRRPPRGRRPLVVGAARGARSSRSCSRASRCGPRYRADKVRGDALVGRSSSGAPRQPELPSILLEDVAALTGLVFALFGVGLTLLTGNASSTCAARR